MEEKTMKTVKMSPEKDNNETKTGQQKLSYEELNNACSQLYQQNQVLRKELQQVQQAVMLKRLDYLFRVVEHHECFSTDFVEACEKEIKEALTVEENEENSKEN